MKLSNRLFASVLSTFTAMLVIGPVARATTIAHWDFNSTNAVDGAFLPGNGERRDLNGNGAMDADDFRIGAVDLSGNGNHLTAWTSSWMKWSADSVQGDFSMEHNNSWPASGTDSSFNPGLTGIDAETITPARWTVEAVFKSANLSGISTIVGRDGRFPDRAAALYLSTRGTDLAIEYRDVDGARHNLQVPANLKASVWYSVAATSDGSTLKLYLNSEEVGTLDLTTTGTDTSLGLGYGTWTVARGMWNNGHADRFYGKIDEVAISDEALDSTSFVIYVPEIYRDSDRDGMSDLYETFFHLNPTNAADAQENYDADALRNFAESLLSTDPRAADTDTDGLNDDVDQDPLSRAVMLWGNPWFTEGDNYTYTGPDWWLGAGKIGGEWSNGAGWTVAAYDQGRLYIDIDRAMINSNLVLNLLQQDVADCQVYLDLGSTNGIYVATNLYGNVTVGSGEQVLGRYIMPLADYPTASRIYIDATAGVEPYTVYLCTLYEDADTDGLDALQEIQFGTLDTNPDTDMDNLTDYIEAIVEGTDPLNKDTDGDGFSDGQEILEFGSSPFVPMQQEGGVSGYLQVERWYGIEGISLAALTADGRFGADPDDCILVSDAEYAPENLDAAERYGIRMRGTITAPVSGTYTFQLTGDDAAQVWLSDTESPYRRRLLLDLKSWTDFEDLGNSKVPTATVELASNQACYVEILLKEEVLAEHVSLWWTLPGEANAQIIGSQYIHSYVQPYDDQDADGLPDAWETAAGLSPTNGIGGGLKDSDGDGYIDFMEYTLDLDPTVADEDGDGLSGGDEATVTLTDLLNADTDGDGTNDLTTVQTMLGADFVDHYDGHSWSTWSTDGTNAMVNTHYHAGSWVAYQLCVTNAGMYRLAVDARELGAYLGIPMEVQLGVEIDGVPVDDVWMNHSADLPAYTCFTPWLSEGAHTLKLTMLFEHNNYWDRFTTFQIRKIELGAIDGADADGNGIQDWMDKILAKGGDSDGDGITDADEINVYGTGVLDADSDDDGLTDGEELAYGADPLNADTDGDGVIDGIEVNEILTDLLTAEFDGTSVTVLAVPAAQTNAVAGEWEAVGSELLSKGRRGYVEYTMDFPTNDLYCLTINAAHIWHKSTCSPVEPIDTSAFLVYVDGTYIGEYPLHSADGVYTDVRAFLPVLPAGEHTVRLFWDNVHTRLAVQIKDLKLQSLGGPDNNSNGVKDWVEASIAAMAGVDAVPQVIAGEPSNLSLPRIESYISPACAEGNARYPELASLEIQSEIGNQQSAIARGAGFRWYANLPLDPDGTTTATATFQNGALEVPFTIDWVPYNIIDHDGETLYVRKGDSVKFVALPEAAVGGQFEIEYTLDMDGETVRSPNTRPLTYLFPSAGTYTITGQYTHGNDTVTAAITVVVFDGAFPEENPACLVGKTRDWTFCGMPSNVVYETDGTVNLSVLSRTANVTNQSSIVTRVSLEAHDANGIHMMVARTSPDGPILDAVKLSSCWIQNAADGYFWTVAYYDDSQLWEVESLQQNLPPTVDLQIKIFVAGVTLDDYTLERTVYASDYDGAGIYRFRLFHPNNVNTSVCHTFMAYQDGQFVGEILTGEGN